MKQIFFIHWIVHIFRNVLRKQNAQVSMTVREIWRPTAWRPRPHVAGGGNYMTNHRENTKMTVVRVASHSEDASLDACVANDFRWYLPSSAGRQHPCEDRIFIINVIDWFGRRPFCCVCRQQPVKTNLSLWTSAIPLNDAADDASLLANKPLSSWATPLWTLLKDDCRRRCHQWVTSLPPTITLWVVSVKITGHCDIPPLENRLSLGQCELASLSGRLIPVQEKSQSQLENAQAIYLFSYE